MRTTVTGLMIVLAGAVVASAEARLASALDEPAEVLPNLCVVDTPPWRQGWREYGTVLARFYAADARASLGRTALQLQQWSADSVQLVVDASICGRIDSMARTWLGSASADSLGLGSSTWSTIAVFRVNPGKYLHYPLIDPKPSPRLVLVVDSASGVVTYQQLAY